MLISNLTESVFCPTLSNASRSLVSPPVGSACCCCCGVIVPNAAPPPPKSRGIGGRFLLLAGEFERRGDSSGCSVAEASSEWGVGVAVFIETLKNEDEPLLCAAPNVGPPPLPDGRPGSSFSFSLDELPFTLASPPPRSLSLRPMPKESFDALRTIRLVVPPESPDPAEPCLRCFLGEGVGVPRGSCSDEMSIDGR
jgi:hypothetical protein